MMLSRLLVTVVFTFIICGCDLVAGQSKPLLIGAYLGCFDLAKLPTDPSKFAQFTSTTIGKCMPYCIGDKHTMHVISSTYECRCMTLIPDASARLPAADCNAGGSGVAVFYRHKEADKTLCRLANVALQRDSFDVHYNAHHVSFYTNNNGSQEMMLTQEGGDGIRLATNDGWYTYGQYQVTAKIAGASGVVTAFYVRSSDSYTLANNDSPFHEIDFEFLNGNPAPANSIWLNSFKNGMSGGETLVKPVEYQKLLNLQPTQTADNTYITYGFDWQPDHVMWSLNGKPLLKRVYDQKISWTDMKGKTFFRNYRPPTAASHVTFSMWSDGDQSRAFGGKLDWSKSPFRSYVTGLKRVLCDQPVPTDPAEAAAAMGPAWLLTTPRPDHDSSRSDVSRVDDDNSTDDSSSSAAGDSSGGGSRAGNDVPISSSSSSSSSSKSVPAGSNSKSISGDGDSASARSSDGISADSGSSETASSSGSTASPRVTSQTTETGRTRRRWLNILRRADRP